MILRDAIFSGERRHLGARPAPAAVIAPTLAPNEPIEEIAEVREMAAPYTVRGAEAQPLSSDRVASWLVTQDGATRTALAAMLAEEMAAIRDAAVEEGRERGFQQGVKEARDRVTGSLAALEALNTAASAAFDAELAQLQNACADVVAEAFFKLAGEALVSPAAVVGTIGEVLKRVREERELRIHVCPADLPLLQTAEAGIAAKLPGRNFTLVPDSRVETGGCIVQSALGSLDGRLEVQLAELCATLRAAKTGEPG
jgi:flagellar assembly protein FliH